MPDGFRPILFFEAVQGAWTCNPPWNELIALEQVIGYITQFWRNAGWE